MTRVVLGTAFHTPAPDRLEVLEGHAFVLGEDGKIARVLAPDHADHGPAVAAAQAADRLTRLEADAFLVPGMVDLHVHAPQWPQLGKALDEPLEIWLDRYTFPLEAKFADAAFARETYDDMVGTLLALGTTTAVYFGSVDVEPNVILAETCLRHGQRALVGKVAMDHPETCPPGYRDASAGDALDATRRFVARVRALAGTENPLVLPVITPRFIPSCTDELLAGLGALAAELDCHVQTHCSESDWEVGHVHDRLGQTDCEALDGFGLMTPRTVLAHSNFVTGDDLGIMRRTGAAVAHCPMSNAYFANAVFPMRRALDEGVEAGLGTDISGGFSASLFDAARHALMASRHACGGTDPARPPQARGSAERPLSTIETFWAGHRRGRPGAVAAAGPVQRGLLLRCAGNPRECPALAVPPVRGAG